MLIGIYRLLRRRLPVQLSQRRRKQPNPYPKPNLSLPLQLPQKLVARKRNFLHTSKQSGNNRRLLNGNRKNKHVSKRVA